MTSLIVEDLPLLDLICKTIYETIFINGHEDPNSRLNNKLVSIVVESTPDKVLPIMDFLYSRKYVYKYKKGLVQKINLDYDICSLKLVRSRDFPSLYQNYPYVSLFSPSLWDINTLKRFRLITELAKISPFPLKNMFQFYNVNPTVDTLGAKSLAEFEKLIIEDLKVLVSENIIIKAEVVRNEVCIYYSTLSLERLALSIDSYLNKINGIPTQKDDKVVHKITYTRDRKILLDNKYMIANPNFDSENDNVFKFLYEHPNTKWSKEDLVKHSGQIVTKEWDKIVENLGFKGDLRRVFFDVSKTHVKFNNPITDSVLQQLGISQIRI